MIEISEQTSFVEVKLGAEVSKLIIPKPLSASASLAIGSLYDEFNHRKKLLDKSIEELTAEKQNNNPDSDKIEMLTQSISKNNLAVVKALFDMLRLVILNYDAMKTVLDRMSFQNLLDLFAEISEEMTSTGTKKKLIVKSQKSSKKRNSSK